MSENLYIHELALVAAILLTSISQTLLRAGARSKSGSVEIIFNPATMAGYLLFFMVIVLAIFALQAMDLKTVMAWNAATYILTPIISFLFIREPLDRRITAGSAIIVIGLLVFNL